jgi:hypothetical protein
MFIGWLTCIPAVLLPHSLRRFTTANAPANRQMPIASVVSSKAKKIKKTNMYKLYYLTVLIFITLTVSGQTHKFSRNELKTDLDSLISFIEQVHPNPYANVSKKEIYRDIARSKKIIPDSASLIEYFAIVTPIISKLQDGHTQIIPPLAELKSMNPYCLPFNPEISEQGKLYIPENLLNLPQGAEIVSINAVSSKHLFQKLLSSIGGESYNWRVQKIKGSFSLRYGAFYGFTPNYTIKYKTGTKIETSTITGSKYLDLLNLVSEKQKKVQTKSNNKNQPYSFKLLEDSKVGFMDFKSFTGEAGFPAFLDSAFLVMKQKNAESLILDLRNNGGGNSWLGDELFQYISKVPFSQFGKVVVNYSNIRKLFYEKNRSKLAYLSRLSDSDFNAIVYGSSNTTNQNSLKHLRENPLRFSGSIYLLTGINTFSSASDFAWCFQNFKMGKIVGEETGGFIVCFGDYITTPLPKTNLELIISTKVFYGYGATDKERHGIIPDYKVPANKALDFTLKLIRDKE